MLAFLPHDLVFFGFVVVLRYIFYLNDCVVFIPGKHFQLFTTE